MTTSTSPAPLSEVACVDRASFYDVANADLLARMRTEAPVLWYEPANTWVLSRYEDIRYASKTPELFSAAKGILLNDAKYGESIADAFFAEGSDLIATLDPPRHGEVRRTLAPAFTPNAIGRLETSIRECSRELIARIVAGQPVDFVHAVARELPIRIVAELMGVPAAEVDVDQISFWSDEMVKMGAPLSREELATAAKSGEDMGKFLMAALARKRAQPGPDLLSTLSAAELDNAKLNEGNILMLSIATLVAGNETTRNLLSGCIWALASHPEQLRLLASDPALAKSAVEEVLRWVTPVPGFTRNATRDIELRGQNIKAGDYVYLLYFAGNRDEDCWSEPDIFDITRPTDTANLAFGHGQHVCIGAALARLEARCFLEELFTVFSNFSLAGTSVRVDSVMQYGFKNLPVIFQP